jgi:glycerol-3-phosphate acyltransferase PlsY
MLTSLFIVIAYLLGSLSSAIIICRLAGLPDPRSQGSGNPGATNVLRLAGKKTAALVFVGDAAKGLLPVVAAKLAGLSPLGLCGVALAAFIGHLYPVFFRFEGGKGVATALGVWFGISLLIGTALLVTWVAVAALFRMSSLAALISAVTAPLYTLWLLPQQEFAVMAVALSALLIWRHRSNIRNIARGTEPRIGQKRPDTPAE